MLQYLKQLSGFFFYLLGASFFIAYLLLKNDYYARESAMWLQVADLPLLLSAVIYGGTSLYLSVKNPEEPSRALPYVIAAPLVIFFGVILVMNFWV